MPSFISFSDENNRYRPNVYTRVLVDEGPATASTGAVAIVGDFPELKPNTPKTFNDKLSQNDYFLNSNETLNKIANLVYRPTATQDASIQSLTLVNANQSTQANKDFGSILVSSKLYGVFGNRLQVKINDNNDLYDLVVRIGSEDVEQVVGLGEGTIADILYTPAQTDTFNAMNVAITSSDFTVTGSISATEAQVIAGDGANFLTGNPVASGQVTVTSNEQQADTSTEIVITGLNLEGQSTTETVTLAIGETTGTTTASFSRIDNLEGDADADGDFTITFPVYTKALSDISDFGAELDNIVSLNSEVLGTFTVTKPARKTTGLNLDELNSSNCFSSTVNFSKDAQTIVDWFNTSSYVEATLETRGTFVSSDNFVRLINGSKATSISTSNYQSAFDSIKGKPINIVVPFTTEIGIHKMARQHALDSAERGYERNVWVGASANLTVENTYTQYSRELNSRNVAVVNQSIKLTDGKTYSPEYLALVLAGMQGATAVGTPLTRKRPTPLIVETVQNFDVEEKANLAIRRGIVLLSDPRGTGLNVERSVTTWLEDDNKVFSEVSANESLNICVRTVRNDLQPQIGTKITGGKQADIQRIVNNTLRDLVKVGFILSFQDIDVSISNDTANVSFAISVIQPLNFIVATINVR